MTSISYLRTDVFTTTAFTGNPLAVVIDPPSLTADQMQAIAAEFNLSETVFVSPLDPGPGTPSAEFAVRIFTPKAELPFAGHPTVGAALALVETGRASGPELVLHEAVGPVTVSVVDGHATLTTPIPPAPVEAADPGDVADTLGITLADLHPAAGPSAWSAGVPFTIVTVRDLDLLAAVAVDHAAWTTHLAYAAAPELYVLCPLDGIDGHRWRARMFAPGIGVAEDPATGSAAAAAAGYLAGRVSTERQRLGWQFTQGVEMGRASTLDVGLVLSDGELTGVTVGGRAITVGSGTMVVPG